MQTVYSHPNLNKRDFKRFVIAGVLGGTKLRIAVYGYTPKKPVMIFKTEQTSDSIQTLIDSVNDALKQAKEHYNIEISEGVIGVAGPVSQDRTQVQLTNLSYAVTSDIILKNSMLKRVFLMNDLEAIGLGVTLLDADELIQIKLPGVGYKNPVPRGNKAVIAAGTGLGEDILVWSRGKYWPIASEGGHCLLAGKGPDQQKIVKFLTKKGKVLATPLYEDVLSGRGLVHIYEFYRKQPKMAEDKKIAKAMKEADDLAPLISKYGIEGKSKPCTAALNMFIKFYANECFNLALKGKALGGLYIVGSIAVQNLPKFTDGLFAEEFLSPHIPEHPIMDLVRNIPLFLVKSSDVNLLGAAQAAFNPEILNI
ncbi:MAG: glucokinase [Nanoarchaeota archaeon]|nr:glucokinase [Nanoarchaeota archaeon]